MGLKKLTEKISDYHARLESGKASKIKPTHVTKVLGKLQAKESALKTEIAATEHGEKRQRLARKLEIAQTQIKRAKHLLQAIS